jgi:hypothetical protein
MPILNTPYPKSTVSKFTLFLGGISLIVAFILIVFQPFGTASFSHPFKYGILIGYGAVIFASGSLFYVLINYLLSDEIKNKWTVGYEIVLLFTTILISQSSCFLYWVWLFGVNISWAAFFNFLIIASSVSILPVGFYLLYIYQKYRDVQHAKSTNEILNLQDEPKDTISEQPAPDPNTSDNTVKITGTGKKENYIFSSDSIVFIVAEDNYSNYMANANGKPVKMKNQDIFLTTRLFY